MTPPEPRLDPGYAAAFAGALLDPRQAEPACLDVSRAPPARFNVYRNNVVSSLADALADIFPATERIVGTEFFRAMARLHIRAAPPVSPLLFDYGRDFPIFIDGFEPAAELPWLGDVARIERAWLDAYHAADAPPLAARVLAAIPPERLGETRFVAHPAARMVRSAFPALSIFAANRRDEEIAPMELSGAEDALVARPSEEVAARAMPPGGAAFLGALFGGATLGEAATAAAGESTAFDLAANIAGMIEAGVLAAIREGST